MDILLNMGTILQKVKEIPIITASITMIVMKYN